MAYPPAGLTDQESLLEDLRKAVVTVEPDWAALQPRGGFAVPGLDLNLPASGVLDHPWVRRQWIGDRRRQLRSALAPVTPEPVGDGLLFVTARDPRNPAPTRGCGRRPLCGTPRWWRRRASWARPPSMPSTRSDGRPGRGTIHPAARPSDRPRPAE